MTARGVVPALLVVAALAATPAAAAKDFGPGDLRVCNAHRCVPIVNRAVLPPLGRFYYSYSQVAHVADRGSARPPSSCGSGTAT